ncbi:MAG: hypothetical protein DRI83_11840 [Bacteroidetes bacterium]|nr:MAG: hypothetical protein DRI83_11840 [Bacteroidota bacterium]
MMPDNRIKNARWLLAGILLITFLAYLPSLNNGFTNWDDPEQVIENRDIQELSFSNTSGIFSTFYVGMYQPVTTQVYGVVYSIFGADALAFHSVSLLLHLLNVILVFLLVRKFSRRDSLALITAALFALNPMQTESVAWISAMSNLLYTTFYLAGLITYIDYVRRKQTKNLLFTLSFFMLSLLSKPAAVTFPIVIFLADLYFRRRISVRLILEKAPFLLLSLAIGLLIIFAREEAGHIVDMSERFTWLERTSMIFYALSYYFAKLFIPLNLSAFHPYPPGGALPLQFYFAPLIPLMLVFLLFRLKGEIRRQVMAGLLFSLLTIAVVLEIIPIGAVVVKERYVYLPSVGVYYAFAALLLFFVGYHKKYQWITPVLTILMVVFFSIITFSRAGIWQDSFTLWNDVISKHPEASVAYINRGNAWQEKGDYNRAIADYSMAVKAEPNAADAYLNRGLAYYKLESTTLALQDFNQAILLGANDAEAYNSRGLLRASIGQLDMALSDFVQASVNDPLYVDAWINQGLMYANKVDFKSAMHAFSRAIDLDKESAKAYFWRGMVKIQLGTVAEACSDFETAVSYGWPKDQVPGICR